MEINYNSIYHNLANQTLDWLPMDTEELYKTNLKNNYSMLETNNWINNLVTYKFNSCGFRSENFSDKPNIVFVGCSLTMGVGINAKDRWTEIVSKHLNLKCNNLGIGGGSHDTAFRLALGWIDKLNPSIVVLRNPVGIRIELVSQSRIINLQCHGKQRSDLLNKYMKLYSEDDMNNDLNYLKNIMALSYFCEKRNVKFVEAKDNSPLKVDFGRDLAHPGIISNQKYADYVLSII